ncbi:hypothetical protein AZE42_11852 [Rhizopogon vesiculosus]|uniref:Uncharacterized protein n=1 Tax=Rhizopogon vesiculosus TaxID=180088 RepID=A0A1J8Q3G2_9AGAM|nr:hypothetical protein AZE42_11852 [Rhizopogon vesiculosus]
MPLPHLNGRPTAEFYRDTEMTSGGIIQIALLIARLHPLTHFLVGAICLIPCASTSDL